MAQYIYTMNGVAKVVPPKRHIIRDISLSFFPGAKIGVLGLNGSGKSTLMRIMAGLDTDFDGEARPQPGIKIGYLPQEPELDASKDVRGNVEEGVADTKGLIDRFNEISMKFADPMGDDEMNSLLEEQGKLQDAIDAAGAWELDRKLEIAADALRLPPWDADVTTLSGGERRRAELAMAVARGPSCLLADEPFLGVAPADTEFLLEPLGVHHRLCRHHLSRRLGYWFIGQRVNGLDGLSDRRARHGAAWHE